MERGGGGWRERKEGGVRYALGGWGGAGRSGPG